MSNELSTALRKFADDIDAGKGVPNASQCVVVLANEAGQVASTYIGNKVPARDAGLLMLGLGIQRFVVGMGPQAQQQPMFAASRGSTH